MLELNPLLLPLADVSPCGPNLEYDSVFLQLEAAANGKAEQRIGNSIKAAVEPDWLAARALCLALFSHTKDLRVAVYLLRAELRLNGIPGLAFGLKLIAGLLQRFNDTVHPMPDTEEGDTIMRQSALASLNDTGPVLADLRAMPIGEPGSSITGRSIELACDITLHSDGKSVPTVDEVHLALQQQEQCSPELLHHLYEARDAAWAIDEWIEQNLYSWKRGLDLGALKLFIELLLDATTRALVELAEPQEPMTDNPTRDVLAPSGASHVAQIVIQTPSHTVITGPMPEPFRPLDIEPLLAPISDTEPCGPDEYYDPQFLELEQAAKTKPEQQFGKLFIPAEAPDWQSVLKMSVALFARTKDLRVAIYLLRAATRLGGLDGAATGMQVIHKLLANYWEGVHPILDADDDNDPTYRVNVLSSLSAPDSFLGDLRGLGFGDALTTITGRSIELVQGDLQPGETECIPSEATVRQALVVEALRNPALLLRVREVHQAAIAIESALAGHVGDMCTVLQPLLYFTQSMMCVMQRVIDLEGSSEGGATGFGLSEGSAGTDQWAEKGDLDEERREAMRVLEQVCAWMEQAAFDVPRECRRARRLTETRFIEIVRCLMPERVNQVENFFDSADR